MKNLTKWDALTAFEKPLMKPHSMDWLVEPIASDPAYVPKHMFGCRACYYSGLLTLVLAGKEEPWNGLLVATDRQRHESLVEEFPDLAPHPVLPKWLYLSQENRGFEEIAHRLIELIRQSDPRIGVMPRPRKKRTKPKRLTGKNKT